MAVKKIGKEHGSDDHNINRLCGEFSLVFHSAKSQRTHSFRVKYVVCPPTKVVLDLTELFSSTVSLSFPSLAAKNICEELDINNVCELIFLSGKIITNRR